MATEGLEGSPMISMFRLVDDKLIQIHLGQGVITSDKKHIWSLEILIWDTNAPMVIGYIETIKKCCFFESKGVEHGTPPNNSAPGLSRKVCFKAKRNPVDFDKSSRNGSLMMSIFLLQLQRTMFRMFFLYALVMFWFRNMYGWPTKHMTYWVHVDLGFHATYSPYCHTHTYPSNRANKPWELDSMLWTGWHFQKSIRRHPGPEATGHSGWYNFSILKQQYICVYIYI